jgi:hypothetical protein
LCAAKRWFDRCIRIFVQVTAGGIITTVVGFSTAGAAPVAGYIDNVPATSARLNLPTHIVLDPSGNWIITGAVIVLLG